MNNENRQKLRFQKYHLESLGNDIDIMELDAILNDIERLKEEEQESIEQLKGGLKETDKGINIENNVDVFIEVCEIVEKLREHINNLNESIVDINEAL